MIRLFGENTQKQRGNGAAAVGESVFWAARASPTLCRFVRRLTDILSSTHMNTAKCELQGGELAWRIPRHVDMNRKKAKNGTQRKIDDEKECQ